MKYALERKKIFQQNGTLRGENGFRMELQTKDLFFSSHDCHDLSDAVRGYDFERTGRSVPIRE